MGNKIHTCNITDYKGPRKFIDCGKPATWKNPQWPKGKICDAHKKRLEVLFVDGWSTLEEEYNA